jgi:hypothetical protein
MVGYTQCLGPSTARTEGPTACTLSLLPLLLSILLLVLHNLLQVHASTTIQRLIHSDLSFCKYQPLVKFRLAVSLKDVE